MTRPHSLAAIIALARAGATDHALRQLDDGWRDEEGGPVLTVKGRLLKDLAARRVGEERRRLLEEAAAAYERSAAEEPASYPLINAATLYFLTGAEAKARHLAEATLARLDGWPGDAETPYYSCATRAEALLLLDRHEEAQTAFAEAIGLAPQAWEDHASTLRQFTLILAEHKRDSSWLDANRPPRSLHFGGHMSFDPEVVRREHLDEKIAAVLEEENVGFGFGALAAGADIIIAEALLARGAELHAVLPGGEAFAAVSVDPFGQAWRRRFDAVLASAETVRPVRPLGATPDSAMIGLADEVAMGAALMNGRRLESSAVQLLVLDSAAETGNGASGRSRGIWAAGGWRQRILTAPRETRPDLATPTAQSAESLAVLAVGLGADQALPPILAGLHEQVARLPAAVLPPYLTEDRLILAFRGPGEAAEAAVRLLCSASEALPLRIGGQYGLAPTFRDPFSNGLRLDPAATAAAAGALASAPPGTACVTDDFAAALAAAGPRRPASEYIGELVAPDGGPPVGLYALKSYDQLFQPLGGDDGQ